MKKRRTFNAENTTPTKEGLHTPGEWAIRPRGDKSFYDNGAFVSIYSKELGLEGGNICSIYSPSDKTNSHKPTDEQKANAELIVKAVNFYQKLPRLAPDAEVPIPSDEYILKAVNERQALLDSHRELQNALDAISDRLLTWQSQYPDNWDELDQVIFDKAVKALNNAKNIKQ